MKKTLLFALCATFAAAAVCRADSTWGGGSGSWGGGNWSAGIPQNDVAVFDTPGETIVTFDDDYGANRLYIASNSVDGVTLRSDGGGYREFWFRGRITIPTGRATRTWASSTPS